MWKPSSLKYFANFTKFSSTPLRKFSVDIIGKIFRCCMHVPDTCSRSEFLKQPIKSLIKLFLTDLYHKKKLSETIPFIVSQFNNYMYVSCTFADQYNFCYSSKNFTNTTRPCPTLSWLSISVFFLWPIETMFFFSPTLHASICITQRNCLNSTCLSSIVWYSIHTFWQVIVLITCQTVHFEF